MWKTTDRYVQQKRVKAVEAELKLKQVYIPQYNSNKTAGTKGGNNIYNGTTNGGADVSNMAKPCESCAAIKTSQVSTDLTTKSYSNLSSISFQWYPWTTGHVLSRLCQNCWDYWKKYGGLKCKNDGNDDKKKLADQDDDKVSDLSNRQLHK